jgi:hypothetical protein
VQERFGEDELMLLCASCDQKECMFRVAFTMAVQERCEVDDHDDEEEEEVDKEEL